MTCVFGRPAWLDIDLRVNRFFDRLIDGLITSVSLDLLCLFHMCWLCACHRESLGQIRAVLQRGLETIRLVGHGRLDIDLVVHLARTFAFRVMKYYLQWSRLSFTKECI